MRIGLNWIEIAVEQLGRFGIRAEARLEQLESLAERLGTGSADGDGWLISWAMGADPDPHGVWHSSQIPDPAKRTAGLNVSGFSSADLDKAIDAGRSPRLATGCEQPVRAQHYETFNRVLNTQQPYLFAYTPDTLLAVPRTLRGLAAGTFALHADVHRWWLQK